MTTTILIAEDDPLLRGLLAEILKAHDDFEIAGSVGDGREVLDEVARRRPQVLLLDLNLPGLSGLQVLEKLAGAEHQPFVLVLSGDESEETQLEAARAGAQGFLCKSQAMSRLPEAIRGIAGGEVWFTPRTVGRIFRDYPRLMRNAREQERPINRLSPREREVLIQVARGRTNPQIAEELFMSVSTVKVHIQNIFHKLELPNRTEAAVFAVREGLLETADTGGRPG